jgi:hypothetical protein
LAFNSALKASKSLKPVKMLNQQQNLAAQQDKAK